MARDQTRRLRRQGRPAIRQAPLPSGPVTLADPEIEHVLRLRHRAEAIARRRAREAGAFPGGRNRDYRRFLAEELSKRQGQINRLIGKRQRRQRPR